MNCLDSIFRVICYLLDVVRVDEFIVLNCNINFVDFAKKVAGFFPGWVGGGRTSQYLPRAPSSPSHVMPLRQHAVYADNCLHIGLRHKGICLTTR